MLYKQINRSDPEKVFITVKNSWSTAALSAGEAVAWDYTTDCDGVSVTLSPAAQAQDNGSFAFAGIVADETINVDQFGLIQVWGYNSAVYVANTSAGTQIAKGDMLCLDAYASHAYLIKQLPTYMTKLVHPCGFAMEAHNSRTPAKRAIFIKGL